MTTSATNRLLQPPAVPKRNQQYNHCACVLATAWLHHSKKAEEQQSYSVYASNTPDICCNQAHHAQLRYAQSTELTSANSGLWCSLPDMQAARMPPHCLHVSGNDAMTNQTNRSIPESTCCYYHPANTILGPPAGPHPCPSLYQPGPSSRPSLLLAASAAIKNQQPLLPKAAECCCYQRPFQTA